MTKVLHALLQKEMSRKEFLMTAGLAVGSLLGFSTLIRMLTGKSLDASLPGISSHHSYGNGSYGGTKKVNNNV